MTEPSAPVAPASPGPHLQPLTPFARRSLYGVIGVIALALVFGGWGLWQVLGNTQANQPTPAQMQALQKQIDVLEQRSATLSRSDQISREANRDLQGALAERDEEVAGLRADVAFYERFVGATAQRRGLAVHELQLQPQTDQAWRFTATLTQNLNRGAVNAGQLKISVEGTHDGKLQKLAWDESVSYTHLDVYKRQALDSVVVAGLVLGRSACRPHAGLGHPAHARRRGQACAATVSAHGTEPTRDHAGAFGPDQS